MEDLGTQAGQFQHFVKGDLIQLSGTLNVSGICCVHAVHVGVNLAQVCLQGSSQSNGGRIGTAAAQGSDVVKLVQALETGNDDDGVVSVQLGLDTLGADLLDLCAAVAAVGLETSLPAGEGNGRITQSLDGHGAQGAGHLLAGGQQHIHLTLGCLGVDLHCLCNELIRGLTLGGEDGHHLVTLTVGIGDDAGNVFQPLLIGHRGAAKFLYDQSHILLTS